MVHDRTTVAAVVPSVMDRSRFGGHDVEFVTSADEARAVAPAVLVVDIDRVEQLTDFRLVDCRVVGFGSHVDTERRAAAERAGFDEVHPRSAFFRRLGEILQGAPT